MSETTPPNEPDIVDRLLGTLDHYLDLLHDRVLRPIFLVGRTIAFGFFILLVGIVVVTVTLIGAVRLLNVYFFSAHEWITYMLLGAILIAVGLVLWRRRRPVPLRK